MSFVIRDRQSRQASRYLVAVIHRADESVDRWGDMESAAHFKTAAEALAFMHKAFPLEYMRLQVEKDLTRADP